MQGFPYEYSLDEIDSLAARLLELSFGHNIFIFHGDLGAGKSSLIRAMAKALGYDGAIASPSFPILLEYPLFKHYDFYRIDEAYLKQNDSIIWTIEEALESPLYHFIEWPERLGVLLKKPLVELTLSSGSAPDRRILDFNLRASQ